MEVPSLSQIAFAATIFVVTILSYIALTPPYPVDETIKEADTTASPADYLRDLGFTKKHATKIAFIPIGHHAIHTFILALCYPGIPSSAIGYGTANEINLDLFTWSSATVIPLVFILSIGIPLRLIPYAALGKNFTFYLSPPNKLVTTGVYRYVQHPSYTGLVTLLISLGALLERTDGVLSCYVPPSWFAMVQTVWVSLIVLAVPFMFIAVWTRVRQEEEFLRGKFGAEWERWHEGTDRFIPRLDSLLHISAQNESKK